MHIRKALRIIRKETTNSIACGNNVFDAKEINQAINLIIEYCMAGRLEEIKKMLDPNQ
jgi:hypothetical protein